MLAGVFGWRISRVASSADLLTEIVFRVKSKSEVVSASNSPARIPVAHAQANIVLYAATTSPICCDNGLFTTVTHPAANSATRTAERANVFTVGR